MNSIEQALRKRNKVLEQQNAFYLSVLERALAEIETLESLSCAFAWDLQVTDNETRPNPSTSRAVEAKWHDAIQAALGDSK